MLIFWFVYLFFLTHHFMPASLSPASILVLPSSLLHRSCTIICSQLPSSHFLFLLFLIIHTSLSLPPSLIFPVYFFSDSHNFSFFNSLLLTSSFSDHAHFSFPWLLSLVYTPLLLHQIMHLSLYRTSSFPLFLFSSNSDHLCITFSNFLPSFFFFLPISSSPMSLIPFRLLFLPLSSP